MRLVVAFVILFLSGFVVLLAVHVIHLTLESPPAEGVQIYRTAIDLGKQANVLGPISARNIDEKRKFVSQGNKIIQQITELALLDAYVDDYCRPDIANNYFRPLMNLICYASDVAEADGKFIEASKLNIVLLSLGVAIACNGYEEDYNCRTTCISLATKRLFRLSEKLNDTQCLNILENMRTVLKHSSLLESTDQFFERLVKKEGGTVSILEERHQRLRFYKQYHLTALTLCLAKINVQAHYSKYGKYPEILDVSMKGEFQPEIIESPWKIVYQIKENNCFLYSCGPDNKDDGGDRVPLSSLELNGKGDLVFDSQ
jgi:hypothetical protein